MKQYIRRYYKYFLKNIDYAYLAYNQKYYRKAGEKWKIYRTCMRLFDKTKGNDKNPQINNTNAPDTEANILFFIQTFLLFFKL